MRTHYLYKITHIDSGKWYIGIRSWLGDLEDDHYKGSGKHLRAAIRKYGGSRFKKQILAIVQTREEASRLEASLIGMEQVNDPNCYNLQAGGLNGSLIPPETKKRISAKLKGRKLAPEHAAKIVAYRTGRPLTPETRARLSAASIKAWARPEVRTKISNAMKGKPVSLETRAKIREARFRQAPLSLEARDKLRQATTAMWKNPDMRTKIMSARHKEMSS